MITASNIEQKVRVATKVYYLLWDGMQRQKFTPAPGRDITTEGRHPAARDFALYRRLYGRNNSAR
jgi:hypothetical protein